MSLLGEVTAIVMAKAPAPGRVKSRLVSPDALDAAAAAEVASAMLRCTVARLARLGRVVLAVTPPGAGPGLRRRLDLPPVITVDQGAGDLGTRIDRVWRAVGGDRPVAFFGMDCPDVPVAAVAAIPRGLREADVVVGPTDDGGYWTIGAGSYRPGLLADIDWGTASVYDQTLRAAAADGLLVRELPSWPDVDEPSDLAALCRRLRARPGEPGSDLDPDLRRLATQLDAACPSARAPGDPP